jgi:hypothetical protein
MIRCGFPTFTNTHILYKGKSKAIPVTGREGL